METVYQLQELLAALPEEAQKELMESVSTKSYNKQEALVSYGDVCQYMFFIQKGLVRTYYLTQNKEINTEFSIEGQFITSIHSFYNEQPSHVAIEALEETTVLRLHRLDLLRCFDKYPSVNHLGRVLVEQSFIRRELWHEITLCNNSKDRYEALISQFPYLVLRVPLTHLASYLGMTKEHLSRIRKTE